MQGYCRALPESIDIRALPDSAALPVAIWVILLWLVPCLLLPVFYYMLFMLDGILFFVGSRVFARPLSALALDLEEHRTTAVSLGIAFALTAVVVIPCLVVAARLAVWYIRAYRALRRQLLHIS